MIVQRGKFIDFWKEGLGRPYYLYFLIDPRSDSICYIGITKQEFKRRLSQHRNPKKTNEARIAKLQRHLKNIDMTLQGEVVAKGSEDFINLLEKWAITGCWSYLGKQSILNHQAGGKDSYGLAPESKKKAWKTKQQKYKKGEYKSKAGENSPTNKLTESQVKNIYKLIKHFYTNKEIIKKLSLNVGVTTINQIRKGVNWKYLWEKEKMIEIPSLNVVEGALGSQEKIDILNRICDGQNNKTIKSLYKITETDLNRIRNKTLWKMAWNIYDNFINN